MLIIFEILYTNTAHLLQSRSLYTIKTSFTSLDSDTIWEVLRSRNSYLNNYFHSEIKSILETKAERNMSEVSASSDAHIKEGSISTDLNGVGDDDDSRERTDISTEEMIQSQNLMVLIRKSLISMNTWMKWN